MSAGTRSSDRGGDDAAGRRSAAFIYGAVGLTALLYVIPFGGLLGRPLVWFSTMVHELGHGIAALLVGGTFSSFVMYADGSGLADVAVSGGQAHAIVSAGGLVGPALVAALGFVLARRARSAQLGLLSAALGLGVVAALLASSVFAIAFIGAVALALAWLALRRDPRPAQIGLVFLSTQLALSVFSRGDYLFVREAHTGGGVFPSDVANMATSLGGTFWIWGIVCGAVSLTALLVGLWLFSCDYPSLARLARGGRGGRGRRG
ncbi:MAG: M50 family metallopeptidase [Myxococcales bacterium]|nr:M50 family metallopeptidase [Myxococcales bacterium]MCB9705466.1 M50 family metallopeptidase [Myxococcales bacterium]